MSLAIITFSKDHDRIYIEPNEDITLPHVTLGAQVMGLEDFYTSTPCQAIPLLSEDIREQFLSFKLPQYREVYPLWTSPPSRLAWMNYDECGEEVKQCLQEFIAIVLEEACLSDQPAIAGKSLFQQLLYLPETDIVRCLSQLKHPQPGWI